MSHLRLALRSLTGNPGFSAVVVLTLAIGIGANTAIFSLLDAVMLKPLPVSKPEELFALHIQSRDAEPDLSGGTGRWLRFPYPVIRTLEVRVDGDPHRIAPMLQQVIGRREPRLAIFNSLAIDERLRQNVRRDTLVVSLTTGFGLLALLLASLGLYGVLAYVVAKRAPEIGVRMALGARPGDVSRMVVADGMRVVLAGVVLGAVATVGAGHIVGSMLFNVSLVEPTTSLGVLTLLAVTALGACYCPARRASRVDPGTALRAE